MVVSQSVACDGPSGIRKSDPGANASARIGKTNAPSPLVGHAEQNLTLAELAGLARLSQGWLQRRFNPPYSPPFRREEPSGPVAVAFRALRTGGLLACPVRMRDPLARACTRKSNHAAVGRTGWPDRAFQDFKFIVA